MVGAERRKYLPTHVRRSIGAYATLVRVPNLFTAAPDVIMGAALAAGAGATVGVGTVAGVALASTLLYAAGTTLNDVVDAPRDAIERPERPIPAGLVSRRIALVIGASALVGGPIVAYLAAGSSPGTIALLLAVTIALYDGVLKAGLLGPVAMGSTRGLNVLLGAAAAAPVSSLPWWILAVALVVTVYIAAVTVMAAEETVGADRRRIGIAGGGVVLATTGAVGVPLLYWQGVTASVVIAATLAGVFLGWTGRNILRAYREPSAGRVGAAVGTCVLALIVFDAALATIGGLVSAVTTLAFAAPAIWLARAFDVS